jgi:hypothetical protein
MKTRDQPRRDWTVLLRGPVLLGQGRAEDGWTDEFEIVCRDCGDDTGLDYHEISPELQRIRGPCPMEAGVTAHERHAASTRRKDSISRPVRDVRVASLHGRRLQ